MTGSMGPRDAMLWAFYATLVGAWVVEGDAGVALAAGAVGALLGVVVLDLRTLANNGGDT